MSQVKDVVQAKGITLSSMQGQLDVVVPGSPEEDEVSASDPMAGDWTPQDMGLKVAKAALGAVRAVYRGRMVTTAKVKVTEVIIEIASALAFNREQTDVAEAVTETHANMYRDAEAMVSTIAKVTKADRKSILLAVRSGVSNYRSFWSRMLFCLEHNADKTLFILDPCSRKVNKKGEFGNTLAFDGRRKMLDAILDEEIAKVDATYGPLLQDIEDAQSALNEARQLQNEAREKALRPFEIDKVEPTKDAQVGEELQGYLAEM